MARSRYTSIDEIMQLTLPELRQLTKTELAHMATQLNSAANKRIRRIEQAKQYSPAVASLRAKDKQLKTSRTASKSQQIAAIRKATEFLQQKTSTVSGAKKYEQKISVAMTGKPGTLAKMSDAKKKRFWKHYRKLEAANPGAVAQLGSSRIMSHLYREMTKKQPSVKAFEQAQAWIDKEYEKMIRESDAAINDTWTDIDEDYDEGDEDDDIEI